MTLVTAAALLMTPVSAYAQFSDVSYSTTSYSDAILWMQENGVVEGYSDGTFGVDQCVNRAEFLVMLYNMLQVDVAGGNINFSDVSESDWFYEYVATGVARGSIDGSNPRFNPGDCVNRVEAIKIAVIEFNDGSVPESPNQLYISYGDVDPNAWYAETFEYVDGANAIGTAHTTWNSSVGEYNFDPAGPMNRDEVAELLYRLQAIEDYGGDGVYGYNDRPSMFNEDAYFFNQCTADFESTNLDTEDALPASTNLYLSADMSTQEKHNNLDDFIESWENTELFSFLEGEFDDEYPESLDYDNVMAEIFDADWEIDFSMDLDLEALFADNAEAYVVAKFEKADEMAEALGYLAYYEYGNDIDCIVPAEYDNTVYWNAGSDAYIARHNDVFILATSASYREDAIDRLLEGQDTFNISSKLTQAAVTEQIEFYIDFNDIFGPLIDEFGSEEPIIQQIAGIEEIYFELGLEDGQARMGSAISFDDESDPLYTAYTDYENTLIDYAPGEDVIFYMEQASSGYSYSDISSELGIYLDDFDTSLTESDIEALLNTPFALAINYVESSEMYAGGTILLTVNSENAAAIEKIDELMTAELEKDSTAVFETVGDLQKVTSSDPSEEGLEAYYGYLEDDVYVMAGFYDDFLSSVESPLSESSRYKASLISSYDSGVVFMDFEAIADLYDRYLQEDAYYYGEEEQTLEAVLNSLDVFMAGNKADEGIVWSYAVLQLK